MDLPTNQTHFGRRALAYLIDLGLIYVLTVASSLAFVLAYSALKFPHQAEMVAHVSASQQTIYFTRGAHLLYYFSNYRAEP